MNSIFESNYFWLTICTLLAVLFNCSEKYFHDDALLKKDEFDEFIKENGNIPNASYNIKKNNMETAKSKSKLFPFAKWIMVFGIVRILYVILTSN
jgi:hypothetical protein